jgi:hypothetical protein
LKPPSKKKQLESEKTGDNAGGGPLPDNPHSEARRLGRKVRLEFVNEDVPVLNRISFKFGRDVDPVILDKLKPEITFSWSEVFKALSLILLDYVAWTKAGGEPDEFRLKGNFKDSAAATLGNAIYKDGPIQELFSVVRQSGRSDELAKQIFRGQNVHGRDPDHKDRLITISQFLLPPDCIEIVWDPRGTEPLQKLEDVRQLTERICRTAGIKYEPGIPPRRETPPETPKPAEQPQPPPITKPGPAPKTATELLSQEVKEEPPKPPPPKADPKPPAEPLPSLEQEQGKLSGLFAKVIGDALKKLREPASRKSADRKPSPAPEAPPAKEAPIPEARPKFPKTDFAAGEFAYELKNQPAPEEEISPPEPPMPPIDPRLFTVSETGGYWPDEAPLIELPGEETVHTWTLKNAFEGVLILGRTGSGKTSGSGFTFAEAFLRAGFGGLVLTVKKNEAEHWRGLCAHCGRENDLVVVRRGGDWKLNVLAYEAQHPGQGACLSENLTVFCRNLLRISTRSHGTGNSDPVWKNAGDQLLNATFDLFLLAGGGITFDRLANFVSAAPTEKFPADETAWLKLPVFGDVFAKAKNAVSSPEDKRIFAKAKDYWFKVYPGYASRTRTSITLGIFAMFDAFRGRDIPALISSETNITPESIMSGKIVILDLPLKELQHTGLMVQSAWKYLFQTALERQHNDNSPRRRPVFLWEDEGQYFFSDHDHHFQDTARSSRVCRVILTQNLNSFYKEFGREGETITNSVFGNLNTKVFHNNSDPQTNQWAVEHFGKEIQTRYSITNAPAPQPKDFFGMIAQSLNPPNTTSVSAGEHWEPAVRPEQFNVLRTGGPENDFMVDAYITWMGLSAERQRHFTQITFQQNPNL